MMNRQGGVPQTMRGIPTGFGGQQQPQQQPGRSVSGRIPNGGKLGNNGSGWSAFGGGVPMGGAGLQNAPRQVGAGNLSFAQSLSGSQPATPLDLSEFPSLSNSAQAPSSSQASMWSASGGVGARAMGGQMQRQQPTPLSQQTQQEEMYSGSSGRLPAGQNVFRFGNQSNIGAGQPSQAQSQAPSQSGGGDDFPPLNRSGDMTQERGASLMSALGFGAQSSPSTASGQNNRAENGLLSVLSANRGASDSRNVPGPSRSQDNRETPVGSDGRQKAGAYREESSAASEASPQASETRNPLGAIGNGPPASKGKEEEEPVSDPLAGMAPADKWGLKGLRTLMNNYPDYNAMVLGIDPNSLGLDLTSSEPISTQIYSLFDDQPPRPAIPHFRLPECYNVTNVQPIDTKISSFHEDTLFYIFYANAGDVTQLLAAQELHARTWRWHKKLQIWLTKDEIMMPQQISPTVERGFYVIWDPIRFQRDRREFTLHYGDLDTTLGQAAQ